MATQIPFVWNKANIVKVLSDPLGQTQGMNHSTVVIKAAIALYNRQTIDEKKANHTLLNNNVGFNAADAKKLSWFGQASKAGVKFKNETIIKNAKRLVKYAGQLEEIALSSIQSQQTR